MDKQSLFNKFHLIESELKRARNHIEGVELLFEEIKEVLINNCKELEGENA